MHACPALWSPPPALKWSLGGRIEAVEFQAWVVGSLKVPAGGRITVHCEAVHTLTINGKLLAGDVYSRGLRAAIELPAGVHPVRMKLRGKATVAVRCSASAPSLRLHLSRPLVLPDISLEPDSPATSDAFPLGGLFSLPLYSSADGWIDSLELKLASAVGVAPSLSVSLDESSSTLAVPPGQTVGLTARLRLRASEVQTRAAQMDHCFRFRVVLEASTVLGSEQSPALSHTHSPARTVCSL